jgi:hypothetical protein
MPLVETLPGPLPHRRLRAEGLRNAVIIAVSDYGQQANRRRFREAGFDLTTWSSRSNATPASPS